MIPKNMQKLPPKVQEMTPQEKVAYRKGYVAGYNCAIKRLKKEKVI